jgi:hypothetical protein
MMAAHFILVIEVVTVCRREPKVLVIFSFLVVGTFIVFVGYWVYTLFASKEQKESQKNP